MEKIKRLEKADNDQQRCEELNPKKAKNSNSKFINLKKDLKNMIISYLPLVEVFENYVRLCKSFCDSIKSHKIFTLIKNSFSQINGLVEFQNTGEENFAFICENLIIKDHSSLEDQLGISSSDIEPLVKDIGIYLIALKYKENEKLDFSSKVLF